MFLSRTWKSDTDNCLQNLGDEDWRNWSQGNNNNNPLNAPWKWDELISCSICFCPSHCSAEQLLLMNGIWKTIYNRKLNPMICLRPRQLLPSFQRFQRHVFLLMWLVWLKGHSWTCKDVSPSKINLPHVPSTQPWKSGNGWFITVETKAQFRSYVIAEMTSVKRMKTLEGFPPSYPQFHPLLLTGLSRCCCCCLVSVLTEVVAFRKHTGGYKNTATGL